MGMFDSLYKGDEEWQTKAYGCSLICYRVGDEMPRMLGGYQLGAELAEPAPDDYQVEVLGGGSREESRDSFATIRSGVLVSIDDTRDPTLPLADYSGRVDHWTA